MNKPAIQRSSFTELAAFICLVALGVGLRLGLQHLPNFAPVAAMALFAGYFFRSMVVAACVPISVMLISDQYIGSYDWFMMSLVYGTLVLPVLLRPALRRLFKLHRGRVISSLASFAGLFACGLASSIVFFLMTNLGSWIWFPGYERSLQGLLHCYGQGVPFFRYTLAGDAIFSFGLFGSYILAHNLNWIAEPEAKMATAS